MDEINKAIQEYISARNNLIKVGQKYPVLIGGNDNMIGRIGEYIAINYLKEKHGQDPKMVLESNNKGFDLIDRNDGSLRTQVKVISSENKNGTSVRLVEGWNQLVLIDLDLDTMESKIGFITLVQFKKITEKNGWSMNPVASRTMLGDKGRIIRGGGTVKSFILYE